MPLQSGAVIYLATYFIFIAVVLLVFTLAVFMALPLVMPKLVRMLIRLFSILRHYVLMHLNRMIMRAETEERKRCTRNGFKKSIYLQILGYCLVPKSRKSIAIAPNESEVESKKINSLKYFFKENDEIKLESKELKEFLLYWKERLGLR